MTSHWVDVAIFCLSLMASNFTDYIREAHRCLVLDGHLHIWEAATYFEDVKKFAAALAKLEFDVTTPTVEGAFVRIYAHKNNRKPDAKLVLPFRGAACTGWGRRVATQLANCARGGVRGKGEASAIAETRVTYTSRLTVRPSAKMLPRDDIASPRAGPRRNARRLRRPRSA